jgi:Pectate lyase superfamily protein
MIQRVIIFRVILLSVVDVAIALAVESGAPRSPRQVMGSSGPRIDVREHGAKGNGFTNDTAAIQAAIDNSVSGSIIYFPRGTYLVDTFKVMSRSGLTFLGEGFDSIVRRIPSAGRIATFEGSADIVIKDIAFDNNGIIPFGGIAFYDMRRVRIENTRFFDSKPQPWTSRQDRYAYVFARGRNPSEDVWLVNNAIENLQVELDHMRRVRVEGNSVTRAYRTAGIGIFTIADGAIAEDYMITKNKIIDPFSVGIGGFLDPFTDNRSVFRRIWVKDNSIIINTPGANAIQFGTGNASARNHGNIFEDIVVEGNVIDNSGAPKKETSLITLMSNSTKDFVFERAKVTSNKIKGHGGPGGGVDLRNIHNGEVSHNEVTETAGGIAVIEALKTVVRDNTVKASINPYALNYSKGGNQFEKNYYIGSPATPLYRAKPVSSDVIVEPVRKE